MFLLRLKIIPDLMYVKRIHSFYKCYTISIAGYNTGVNTAPSSRKVIPEASKQRMPTAKGLQGLRYGVVLFSLLMVTGFIGYWLPCGQMGF